MPLTSRPKCPGPVLRPTTMKIRPSSASAKLQTHPSLDPGLFSERPKSSLPKSPSQTQPTSSRSINDQMFDIKYQERFRRPTLIIMEGLNEEQFEKAPAKEVNINDLFLQKIEEKIDLRTMEHLQKAFYEADFDQSGELELEEFKDLLKRKLRITGQQDDQIDALFQKIDWSGEGSISWDEFCTYMQLGFEEKAEAYYKSREVAFNLPARQVAEHIPHRENVMRILSMSDGSFVAGSNDGWFTFWSSNLELRKQRSVIPILPGQQRNKPKWITYFMILSEYNKVVVSTGDRELEFYELSTFESYCRITSLETVALVMDYCVSRQNQDDCSLFWGDRNGCVNILLLNGTGECLRTWKKAPKREGMASVSFEVILQQPNVNFIRWKVHNDWVIQLKYYDSLRQIVSCSNHEKTALVIGCIIGSTQLEAANKEQASGEAATSGLPLSKSSMAVLQMIQAKPRQSFDQTVFKVYKGVRTFAFYSKRNLLVTGGMDRIIRIWNPYVNNKPIGMLKGHNTPLVYLEIDEDDGRLFSMCNEKCIKVWDIHDQFCLLTVRPKSHKIRGDYQSCHYSPVSKSFMVTTDQMYMLNIRMKPNILSDIPLTHKEPVHCCIYNPLFNQVISASENSTIKVWDLIRGTKVFEFTEAHGEHAITCMTLDKTGRRLMTGARDGLVKMWNYNNGNCLRQLAKECTSVNAEVTCVEYVELNRNKFVVSAGWDRRMNVFLDNAQDDVHHVQMAQPPWPDDLMIGHREDVLSIAVCPPKLLASSDYEGLVIIWNLVSGHVISKLRAPPIPLPPSATKKPNGPKLISKPSFTGPLSPLMRIRQAVLECLDADMSINKLLFLTSRLSLHEGAILITSGPRGFIHMWSVYQNGKLYSRFQGSQTYGVYIQTMALGEYKGVPDSHLFLGDKQGFISVWNLEDYAVQQVEENCPELLSRWRAHTQPITALQTVTGRHLVVSSSLDFTVRLWTYEGHYVGTFGQSESWDIYEMNTYKHPMVPYDVLIDPHSLPILDHPYLQKTQEDELSEMDSWSRQTSAKSRLQKGKNSSRSLLKSPLFKTQIRDISSASQMSEVSTSTHLTSASSVSVLMNDQQISEKLEAGAYRMANGKRLRHERIRSAKLLNHGGPQDYQKLPCYDLHKVPDVNEPNIANNKRSLMSFSPIE